MDRDQNTPKWVQHIAFEVSDVDALEKAKSTLEKKGVEVLGITHHGVFKSIYFFDPNGHRLELATNIGTKEQWTQLNGVAREMIEEWDKTKQPPKQAAWMHEEEFKK